MTPAQAAEHLAVDPATVRRWIRDGRITAVRVGGRYRIDARDLADVISDLKSEPSEPPPSRPFAPEGHAYCNHCGELFDRRDYRSAYCKRRTCQRFRSALGVRTHRAKQATSRKWFFKREASR